MNSNQRLKAIARLATAPAFFMGRQVPLHSPRTALHQRKAVRRIVMEVSRTEGQNNLLKLLEALDTVEADEKRDGTEDAEATVDQTPGEGNASELAGEEGEGNDGDAGDHAKLEDPLVADGIA